MVHQQSANDLELAPKNMLKLECGNKLVIKIQFQALLIIWQSHDNH
jgi:hypothetical protein